MAGEEGLFESAASLIAAVSRKEGDKTRGACEEGSISLEH